MKTIFLFILWIFCILGFAFSLNTEEIINNPLHLGFWGVVTLGSTFLLVIHCLNVDDEEIKA